MSLSKQRAKKKIWASNCVANATAILFRVSFNFEINFFHRIKCCINSIEKMSFVWDDAESSFLSTEEANNATERNYACKLYVLLKPSASVSKAWNVRQKSNFNFH